MPIEMLLSVPGFYLVIIYQFFCQIITKTCLYNFDPRKTPLLYSKTWVYTGVHYFSYFCSKHILWVLVRTALAIPPRRGGSNEYPQSMLRAEI